LALIAAVILLAALLFLLPFGGDPDSGEDQDDDPENTEPSHEVPLAWQPGDVIKWVDFDIPCGVMEKALKLDVASRAAGGSEPAVALDWVEMLSWLAAKYGGEFSRFREKDLSELADKLRSGTSMESLAADMKLYPYYLECYFAALGGLVGPYRVEAQTDDGQAAWEEKYGLKAFSPLADGFPFDHYDDFGDSRSYGYKRRHLGHDMMAQVGTPIIAVETAVVEELGWNRYGGWRVGLRSLDNKRYYYYAHMRQNRPYSEGLEKGKLVYAGEVIGYVGRTGYSDKENVNGVKQSHLHWGMQLIFDESQKNGANEIWIDVYEITKLLQRNKSKTIRDPQTKEHMRAVPFDEPPLKVRHTGGGDRPDQVALPVIMYHSVLKSRAGQNQYIISPEQLEADLRYLHDNGWHTVVMDDLVHFVEEGKPLPDKPILLTFDDGYYNNIYYGEPLLKSYDMRGVMAVVGAFIDKSTAEGVQDPNFSYVSWDTLKEVAERGIFDIQSHSYNMHTHAGRQGCLRRPGEELESYRNCFLKDHAKLCDKLSELISQVPTAFIYPFGAMSIDSEKVIKEAGFKASLSCESGVSILTVGDPESLFRLKRVLRAENDSVQRLLDKWMK